MGIANDEALASIAFIGESLGPLFLSDPAEDAIAPLYEALRSLDASNAIDWPFADPNESERALALIHDGLRDKSNDAIMWEYRRLFVGPAPKAAPPWGSVYTDRECVTFGETTLALRAWLRSTGIQINDEKDEPEDHIGLMFELMAWIARERPELLEEYLRDHLLTWAPHFLDIVHEQAQHPFFKGLALLSRSSLVGIQNHFQIAVATPRFYR